MRHYLGKEGSGQDVTWPAVDGLGKDLSVNSSAMEEDSIGAAMEAGLCEGTE